MVQRRASKGAAGEEPVRREEPRKRAAPKPKTSRVVAADEPPVAEAQPAPVVAPAPVPPEPSASNVLPLFPGFVPDYEWVLGLVVVPTARSRSSLAAPELGPVAALFLEAGSAVVRHVERLSSMTADAVGTALRRALERGEALGLRTPTRIRIGAPAQVELLGEAARHGIEVVVGPAPEVDDVLCSPAVMRGLVAPATEIDVYRGTAPISDTRLAAFFAAAGVFRDGKAWRRLVGAPLRLRVPALGLVDGGMVLLRGGGRGGLLAFRERESLTRALETDEPPLETGPWPRCLAVRFVAPSRLSRARRRELGELPFAARSGPHPVLLSTDADARARPVEDHDYALAIAALLALRRFLVDFGPSLRKPSLQALMARYEQVLELGATGRVMVDLGISEPLEPKAPRAPCNERRPGRR